MVQAVTLDVGGVLLYSQTILDWRQGGNMNGKLQSKRVMAGLLLLALVIALVPSGSLSAQVPEVWISEIRIN